MRIISRTPRFCVSPFSLLLIFWGGRVSPVSVVMAREAGRVYIGDLGSGGSKPELEREFERYGPLKSVWVARNPPGFAFIEFEDPRDAEDAVRDMDGRFVCGVRIRVELAKTNSRPGARGGGDRGNYRDRGPPPPRYRRSPPRRRGSRSRSRSRSPYRGRGSPSPRSRSPYYRSRSPYRRRSNSPGRRRSVSPMGRGRDRSPQY